MLAWHKEHFPFFIMNGENGEAYLGHPLAEHRRESGLGKPELKAVRSFPSSVFSSFQ